jgi:hypothetical protein
MWQKHTKWLLFKKKKKFKKKEAGYRKSHPGGVYHERQWVFFLSGGRKKLIAQK